MITEWIPLSVETRPHSNWIVGLGAILFVYVQFYAVLFVGALVVGLAWRLVS